MNSKYRVLITIALGSVFAGVLGTAMIRWPAAEELSRRDEALEHYGSENSKSLAPNSQPITNSNPPRVPAGQEAALADGTVSMEEYIAAANATVSCVAAGGRTVSLTGQTELRPPSFTFNEPTLEEAEKTRQLLVSCKADQIDAIHKRWSEEHQPTPEQTAAGLVWIAGCIRAHGYDVDVDSVNADTAARWWSSDDRSLRSAAAACLFQHENQFGYRP